MHGFMHGALWGCRVGYPLLAIFAAAQGDMIFAAYVMAHAAAVWLVEP